MNRLCAWRTACAVFLLCVATSIVALAQSFTVLDDLYYYNYNAGSGAVFTQGLDGNLYAIGGPGVYRLAPDGKLSTVFAFTDGDAVGIYPQGTLALATDGNFYGTTNLGGGGIIFKVTPGGKATPFYTNFCSQPNCADGFAPGGVFQGTDGNFYGSDDGGLYGDGTIFKITPGGGKLTTLHGFDGTDGKYPTVSVQASDGNFYGTTWTAGAHNGGTVFMMTPTGKLITLYSFCSQTNCADGHLPFGLIQGADGNFYGATAGGGRGSASCWNPGCGTVFKITAAGKLTTLYRFCSQTNCADGGTTGNGGGPIIQATDGNIYGTTGSGGANNTGTAFRITPAGALTTLHSFELNDGYFPWGLVQATDGNFYGTTWLGASKKNCPPGGCGTIFRLSMGLRPFVSFIRSSGKVGTTVQILGQGFTGTTSVSFNGTPANFTVKSDTYLTATVPAGASSGFVKVATPSSTLTSNKTFRVVPQILSFTPASGPVGTSVVITGESFTKAIHVHFDGVLATNFNVDSDTQITATVPTGATTGKISICTPGESAQSSTSFTVTP